MAFIPGVITEDARKYWPQFFGGIMGVPGAPTVPDSPPAVWDPRIKFFKVGEGGWEDPGTGRVKRVPDAALRRLVAPLIQDLDAVVDAGRMVPRYAADERFTFKKDLTVLDVSFVAPSSIEIACLLDFGDCNDDGFGNSPELWEIGIFTEHPELGPLAADEGLMIGYGTFPLEIKNVSKQILNVIRLVF